MNTNTTFRIYLLSLVLIFSAGISNAQTATNLKLISPAFEDGKLIPAKYTCSGANITPPLSWSGSPEQTKSFALIMDDPDAPMGTWVHWVVYNIPGTVTNLAEKKKPAEVNALEGLNSWDAKEYNGPCPGGTHHYNFKLYALDTTLTPKEGMTKDLLLEAMKGHILSETTLTGIFGD